MGDYFHFSRASESRLDSLDDYIVRHCDLLNELSLRLDIIEKKLGIKPGAWREALEKDAMEEEPKEAPEKE